MQMLRTLLLVAFLAIFGLSTSHADSLIGYFDLNTSMNTVPVAGQVIFTLNNNGTIAVNLQDYGPTTIEGFGYNTPSSTVNSGFTPITPDFPNGAWGDGYGGQKSGFNFNKYPTSDRNQVSFTIDGYYTPDWELAKFTSVWQALGGGPSSKVDFFLLGNNSEQWGANAVPYSSPSAAPEPSSFLMLGSGALGLLGVIRRRLAR